MSTSENTFSPGDPEQSTFKKRSLFDLVLGIFIAVLIPVSVFVTELDSFLTPVHSYQGNSIKLCSEDISDCSNLASLGQVEGTSTPKAYQNISYLDKINQFIKNLFVKIKTFNPFSKKSNDSPEIVDIENLKQKSSFAQLALVKKTKDLEQKVDALQSAGLEQKPALKKEIGKATVERYIELQAQAEKNPETIFQNLLPVETREELRAQLPENIKPLIETDISIQGTVTRLHTDNFEKNKSTEENFIKTEDNSRQKVIFANTEEEKIPGITIEGTGIQIGETIAFNGVSQAPTQQYEAQLVKAAPELLVQTGEKRIALIMVNFPGTNLEPQTQEYFRNLLFTGSKSMNSYYRENSFYGTGGGIQITGDVYGWLTLPPRSGSDPLDLYSKCQSNLWEAKANTILRNQGINLTRYTSLMYFIPDAFSPTICAHAGEANVEPNSSGFTVSAIFQDYPHVYGHEFGHNLYLSHAALLNCQRNPIPDTIDKPCSQAQRLTCQNLTKNPNSLCTYDEYGDFSSVMGNGYGNQTHHFNSIGKNHMGWVSNSKIYSLTSSSTQVTLSNLENPSGTYQILKIPKADSAEHYYISYRQPIGFDTALPQTYTHGATVHILQSSHPLHDSLLVHQNSGAASLTDGESFYDPKNDIIVTQISHNDASVTLKASIGARVTPPPRPTPPPSPFYTSLSATLTHPGPARFVWGYSGPMATEYVDVSTSRDMTQNVYKDFLVYPPTFTVNNPTKWAQYTCGTKVYWRVRQGTFEFPTMLSYIQESIITCNNETQYTNLSASLRFPKPATFHFTFTGPATTHIIDLGTNQDLVHGTYLSFGGGSGSPIVVQDGNTKWPGVYICNKTLYWRVRNSTNNDKSTIHQTTVTCAPTPTPTPLASYSNLSATTPQNGPASFQFSYNGPLAATHYIDLGVNSDLVHGTFIDFGQGSTSPILVQDVIKWGEYSCGKTLYWRVRQGSYYKPLVASEIKSTTITCPPTYSNLQATLWYPDQATFQFDYNGSPTEHVVDLSLNADLVHGTYLDFAKGNASPLKAGDTIAKWKEVYTCGKTLYWRVRQGANISTTKKSDIKTVTIQCPTYTNLNANLKEASATFSFGYQGPATNHHIDVSTHPAMAIDTYINFAQSIQIPITETNPKKWGGVYTCNKTLYWRIRQGDFYNPPQFLTPIQTATVACEAFADSIVLTSASLDSQQKNITIVYTNKHTQPVFLTKSNVIIQGVSAYFGPETNRSEERPVTDFLGTLRSGETVKLCTNNYSNCSNTVSIGSVQGASTNTQIWKTYTRRYNTITSESRKNVLGKSIENTNEITGSNPIQSIWQEIVEGTSLLMQRIFSTLDKNVANQDNTIENLTDEVTTDVKHYSRFKNIPVLNNYFKQQVTNSVEKRQRQLIAETYKNPVSTQEVALPEDITKEIPDDVKSKLEVQKELTGRYRRSSSVMYSSHDKPDIQNYLELADNKFYLMRTSKNLNEVPDGTSITVSGKLLQNEIFVTDISVNANPLGVQSEEDQSKKQNQVASNNVLGTRHEAPVTRKVYVISFVPYIYGQKLWQYYSWFNPSTLASQVISFINNNSNGRVNFVLTRNEEYPIYNQLKDGYIYDQNSYMQCKYNPSLCHKDAYGNFILVDYAKILRDYDVCGKLNRGEIDELWLYGGAYFGYHEATLTGPNAYWYVNGPLENVHGCTKLLPIMGFNYERDWDQATHAFGHRVEYSVARAYGGWTNDPNVEWPHNNIGNIRHNWDAFSMAMHRYPNISYSGCGSLHYPPNGRVLGGWGYDYDNGNTSPSNCDSFNNYPNISLQQTQINCHSWGCYANGHLNWWLSQIPSFDGIGSDRKYNNWWRYIADPNEALRTPSGPPSQPSPTNPPPPQYSYSNLSANLRNPGAAEFSYSYNGPVTTHHIDVSINPDMADGTFISFGSGQSSPVLVSDTAKWSPIYTCGRILYWRIRQGLYDNPSIKSTIMKSAVTCTTPSPTPISGSYSNMSAILNYPNPATFNFNYSGPPSFHGIDVSINQDMNSGTYLDFGYGNSSPIQVHDAASKWNSIYTCGRTLYWRVRLSNSNPAKVSQTQSATVVCNPTPTPTSISLPNPYSNLSSSLYFPSPAHFTFSYQGEATTHYIDMSLDPTMVIDTYIDFALGSASPIYITTPGKWPVYTCGRTFFWRIRQGGYYSPTKLSQIQKATVNCSNITPTQQPPLPPPVTNESIQLHAIALNQAEGNISVRYTHNVSKYVYLTHGSQNVNINSYAFTNNTPNIVETRPISTILGGARFGDQMRLCTSDYSICSQTVPIGTILGVTTLAENKPLRWPMQPSLMDSFVPNINKIEILLKALGESAPLPTKKKWGTPSILDIATVDAINSVLD